MRGKIRQYGWLIVVVLVILGMVLWATPKDRASDWTPVVSQEGKFKVLFPKQPGHIVSSPEKADKPQEVHRFQVSLNQKTHFYSVTYYDLTKQIENARDEESVLMIVQGKILLAAKDSQLKKEQSLQLGSYRGREIVFVCRSPQDDTRESHFARFFLVNKRMYIVSVVGVEHRVPAQDVEKFFHSFELLEPSK